MYSELSVDPGAAPGSGGPVSGLLSGPVIGLSGTGGHSVAIGERGSFCFASCSCGWFAPGRRSRDRARRDAAEHLAQQDGR